MTNKVTDLNIFEKGKGANCIKINHNFEVLKNAVNDIIENDGKLDIAKANTDFSNIDDTARDIMIPAGEILLMPITNPPLNSRLLLCNGATVLRASYPRLFEAIGINFGAGDGETTFNLPDYRGMFLRGLGGNSENSFTTTQNDAVRNVIGRVGVTTATNRAAFNLDYANGPFYKGSGTGFNNGYYPNYWTPSFFLEFNLARVVTTANENRPINKAVNYFIRY